MFFSIPPHKAFARVTKIGDNIYHVPQVPFDTSRPVGKNLQKIPTGITFLPDYVVGVKLLELDRQHNLALPKARTGS